MIKTQHTKGNWRVHEIHGFSIMADDGLPVLTQYDIQTHSQRPEAERKANIQLAAASPKLLIAAQQALRELRQHYLDRDSQAIIELKQAITLATGNKRP